MYEIKFIHKDTTTENTLYTPGDTSYCLTAATLSLEVGAAGELSVSIPDANPAKSDFVCLTDEIIVYRDGTELWRGRAITRQEDFYKTGTLTCEGVLAYLYDTYYPPFEFSGSPTDFLQAVLDNHNSQVEERKQLQLGTVTVEDNNDYIARSSIYYNRTLTVLTDKLINDSLGGYFRVRIEGGVKYLDYLSTYGTTATQPVEFGVNLLDIAQNVEYSDLATVILPLGAKLEDSDGNQTDEYLTIADVNGGSIYYADEAAVEEYGWIVVCNEWEDVTEASNLLTKAQNYLAQVTSAVASFEVNAVDLALVSAEYDYINLGDYVLIQSDPHGIDQYVELTAMKIDLLDPSNDTLTFGADTASLTDSQRSSDRSVQAALETVSTRITNLVATVITTEYLSANYATITELDAVTARIDNITSTTITTEYLEANYATIDSLTAATANITDLTAEVANINSILAGNVGAGTVETVHLTADNVVIDDAVITDAMIVDLTASKITSGTIYTNLVTIQSDSGNLYITDNTIQIQDDNDVVRVQIGEDASGDYNLYLWDASGNLLWDAGGLYAAGIHDGIIKDIAVAEDAAISGTKLDISSVAECLNEDGSITVDYSKVTIDDSTLSVWYTTVNTKTGELEETTSTLQTQLEVVQGQITAKVWQSDIDTAVSNISVGGRNYVLNSGGYAEDSDTSCIFSNNSSFSSYYTVTACDGYMHIECTKTTSTTMYMFFYLSDSFESGESYTLSVRIRAGETSSLPVHLRHSSGTASSSSITPGSVGEWETFTTTVSPSADYTWVGIGFSMSNYRTLGDYVDIAWVKLELGSVATDWTPAPEDAESEITTLSDQYSALNLTVDGITAEVADLTTTVCNNYETLTSKVSTLETTATSITATVRESTAMQSENIIVDGTFEGYTTFGSAYSWYNPNTSYIKVSTYDDVSCIRFTRGGSSYYIRQTVSLPAGTYIVKVKLACGTDYAPVCRIRLYSSSGNVYAYLCEDGELTDEWVTYSTTITTEYTSTYFYLYCYSATGTTTATATEMYATDIVLYSSMELNAALAQIEVLSDSISLCVTTDADTGYLRLGTGDDDTVKFTVDTTNFTVDEDGNLSITGTVTAENGVIGGWNIASTKIYGTAADGTTTAVMQISGLTEDTAYVFACGGTSHSSYADCPFRVNKIGGMWVDEVVVANSLAAGGNVSATALVGGNDNGLYCQNASGTAIRMAYLSTNNNVVLGHSDYATYINGSTVTISANLTASGTVFVPNSGIALANGYGIHHYLSSGSYAKFEYVNASDQLIFGNSSYATYLYGSSITSSKSITTSSDRRLKEDIQPLDGRGIVDALAPVSYRLKDDPVLTHYGFVAQDVEAALDALDIHGSALVQTNAANGMKSIAYVELIPLLVAEIQTLKRQIHSLQKEACK